MSLQSWKKEFYPVPADEVYKKGALAHSLQKWMGLTKEALRKHGLRHKEVGGVSAIIDKSGHRLLIDSTSCALCLWYPGCSGCPIQDVRGERCDREKGGHRTPYDWWTKKYNPRPMLALLKRAAKAQH